MDFGMTKKWMNLFFLPLGISKNTPKAGKDHFQWMDMPPPPETILVNLCASFDDPGKLPEGKLKEKGEKTMSGLNENEGVGRKWLNLNEFGV
jgi:hypothetical protein